MAFMPFLNGDTRSTNLANLVRCVLDECHRDLQSVLEQAVQGDDESRARALLRFTHAAQQRLLRVRAIIGHPTRMRHAGGCRALQWLSSLNTHDAVLQAAPQTLFNSHRDLSIMLPVPIFDVSTALAVFTRGFMPLPGFIGAFNQAPTRPTGRKRRLLGAQANSLVFRLLHQSRLPPGLKLIQVEDIKAVMGADCGYEVAVLLEPAPPAPLDAVIDAVLQLVNEMPPAAAAATEVESKAGTSAAAAADGRGGDAAARPAVTREEVAGHVAALGFTEAAFPAQQPQWRWRAVNVAVAAGSGGGNRMTKQQLQFLRTDLDFRMLHVRHAAMTHHVAQLVRVRCTGAAPPAAEGTAEGAAEGDVPASAAGPSASQGTSATLPDTAHMQAAKMTGSVEKCLREEYDNLLEAALSMPLAIMHSILHDVAGSLTFNAAASAARALKQAPHRWRNHIDVSTSVQRVQMGIRVEIWRNAPLASAAPPPAADASSGAEPGPPPALQPALEVGTLRGAVTCCCDPPVSELWQQAGVSEELGQLPQEPWVDPVGVDLESALLDLASGCAMMQLAMLRKLLEGNFLEQGWTCKDLEAQVRVTLAQSAAPLYGGSTACAAEEHAAAPAGAGGVMPGSATLAGLRAVVDSATGRHSAAERDLAGGVDAAQLRPPDTDARPGPPEAAGGGALGESAPAHRPFARASGVHDEAEGRRPVPLLLVDVRGRLAVAVALDLVSGAVSLHAGDASEYGRAFTTALELEEQQAVLRGIQDGDPPASTPAGTPLAMVAHELGRFLVLRLLSARAAHRAIAARSLRLLPLHPRTSSGGDATGWHPFGTTLLEAYFAKVPAMRARFPQHACFLAMQPSPVSLPLWVMHVRNRGVRPTDTGVKRGQWPHMQFTIAVGLDPAGLTPGEEVEEPGMPPGAPAGTRPLKRVRARMCAALVCALSANYTGIRLVTHIEPAPPQVFTSAQRLLDEGADADAVLAGVGRHSDTDAVGWFRMPEAAGPGNVAAGGRKRARSSDGNGVVTANGEELNGVVRKRPRRLDDTPSTPLGEALPAVPAAAAAAAPTPEAQRESMEVALMVGFLSTRALIFYLRAELDAVHAVYAELEPHAGSIDPLARPPAQPSLQLRTLPYDSFGTSYVFPEDRVPWPLCVPRDGAAPQDDSSVSQVTAVVISPTTWELHVESPFMATTLRALQKGAAGAAHSAPVGKWRHHPTRAGVIVACYSLLRSSRSGMHCWRDVLALLRTRDALAALALVHRPDAAPAAANAAAAAAPGSIQPMHFPSGACDVVAELTALDRICVCVVRTSVAHVASTPPPVDVVTGGSVLKIDLVWEWDTRFERRSEAAAEGSSSRFQVFLYIRSKAVPVAAGAAPPPPGLQERLNEVLWTTAFRLDMSAFVVALACTAEGVVELTRAIGQREALLAELTSVRRVEMYMATAPTRIVLLLSTTAGAEPYAVGVLLKQQGLAMLQFDPRQFATQVEMGHAMGAKRHGSERERRPRALLEVPEWATLVQSLVVGDAAVGRAAGDVHAPWEADDPTGANVVVPQRLLGDVVTRTARFLDETLSHG
eukprot:jgi/Ulvmu1/2169/UM013_0013.1